MGKFGTRVAEVHAVKYRILLDVDGVLGDCMGHLTKLLDCGLKVEDIVSWDFFQYLTPEKKDEALSIMKSGSFWETMPAYTGAAEVVAKWHADPETEVVAVTSPWTSCENWEASRRRWLKREFDIDNKNVVVASRKEVVEGNVLIDDRFENVRDWANAWAGYGYGIMLTQPWNAAIAAWTGKRATNLAEAAAHIEADTTEA